MFANDLYENWDSTEKQDTFIKSYFSNGKVLSKKFQKSKKQSNDSKSDDHQGNSCAVKQNRNNKRSLNDQSKSRKRLKQFGYSEDKEARKDNSNFSIVEDEFDTNLSESVSPRKKKKKKARNKFKIENKSTTHMAETEISNVDSKSNEMDVGDGNCLNFSKLYNRTEVEEVVTNSPKNNDVENRKMDKYSNNVESNQTLSKKKRRKNKIKYDGKLSDEINETDGDIAENNCVENKVTKIKSAKNNSLFQSRNVSNDDIHCVSAERQRISLVYTSQDNIKNKQMMEHPDMLEHNQLKSKKRKKSKNKNSPELENTEEKEKRDSVETTDYNNTVPKDTSSKNESLFQSKIHQKLNAAKFRYLNEMLYTNAGKDALTYFQENTEEFLDYHEGYKSQVSKWPINPVDVIIKEIRQMNKQAVVADLGCGEAKIAKAFPKRTVHSFDLIAVEDCVTACDMANVPLPSNSVDIAVFCLSLMGTNWKEYVKEGHRILKIGGIMKVAEIESRIENLDKFIKNIEKYGLSLINKNTSHKMFVFFNFKKVNKSKKSSSVPDIVLKPCLYKKR